MLALRQCRCIESFHLVKLSSSSPRRRCYTRIHAETLVHASTIGHRIYPDPVSGFEPSFLPVVLTYRGDFGLDIIFAVVGPSADRTPHTCRSRESCRSHPALVVTCLPTPAPPLTRCCRDLWPWRRLFPQYLRLDIFYFSVLYNSLWSLPDAAIPTIRSWSVCLVLAPRIRSMSAQIVPLGRSPPKTFSSPLSGLRQIEV